ncbi:MAG: YARHG domain-containing protein, partial [Bacteroidota bacterium]
CPYQYIYIKIREYNIFLDSEGDFKFVYSRLLNSITMNKYLTLLLLIITVPAQAQYISSQPINASKIKLWQPRLISDYEGTYHFGDSEDETTLLILYTGEKVVAQVISGDWNDDGTAWVNHYRNLSEVKIDKDGNFRSKEYTGQFVIYNDAEAKPCLKIDNPWSSMLAEGEYELGPKTSSVDEAFAGKFPQASTTILDEEELKSWPSEDLQIMRNEIFARYGYTFRPNGKMDQYFRKQSWYKAHHKDVNSFLTSIEQKNIQLIRKEEKSR